MAVIKNLSFILIGVSWIAFLPTIIIYVSNAISYSILYPLQICHRYNGNGFGTFPICDTFPAFSYFGYIFATSGILIIPTIIGVVAIVSYFGITFVHNKRNLNEIWKYSAWMKCLVILLILLSTTLSLVAAVAILVYIVGVALHNIFKKDSPRRYDPWLLGLLLLVLVFQFPRLLQVFF